MFRLGNTDFLISGAALTTVMEATLEDITMQN